ncbi:FAD-dependent oxidoreductase [Eubacterium aggregans]|uniref:FAD-dependent oxidoreductase n=1 Tax=Eubacterium aggregans TaxID=81409 RepID=UPI003F40F335
MLRKLSPCGIFIACGAEPVLPELPGITYNRVVTAERVLCGQVKLKGRVVVVGSGMTGLETAEMLVLSGCRVTLVEMQETVGSGIYQVIEEILAKLEKYPLMVYLKHQLIAIQPEGLLLSDLDTGDKRMLAADSIVLALGVHPRQSVVDTIVRSFPQLPVVAIGDARKSGRILEATQDAHGRSVVFKEDI